MFGQRAIYSVLELKTRSLVFSIYKTFHNYEHKCRFYKIFVLYRGQQVQHVVHLVSMPNSWRTQGRLKQDWAGPHVTRPVHQTLIKTVLKEWSMLNCITHHTSQN
jgi:hypothetical protein